jgi:hypothetical protein
MDRILHPSGGENPDYIGKLKEPLYLGGLELSDQVWAMLLFFSLEDS